jgi:acyl carrier protein
MAEVHDEVKKYIMKEFLPGEDANSLTDVTPLVTGGILDSIATLKLASFLEDRFRIQIEPHELDTENLDSIAAIARLVEGKLNRP